ncbi:MAG: type II secretion system F family protein [Deltaproteobacteria bacterium]|nr:MAG: type II secretion system F family protein [Deltaproteobacteria bacterium]
MDLLGILLSATVFIFTVAIVGVIYLGWQESHFIEKRRVKKRLLYISAGGRHGQEKLAKYRASVLKDIGTFERFALSLPRLSSLDNLLVKAQMPINATVFIIGSVALGMLGFLIGYRYLPQTIAAVGVGLILMLLPFVFLKITEQLYYENFGSQLPEALDLLARAMRSGHALTSGLEMIGKEMGDPIRSEFAATVDEINLGLTLKEAMDNLCERVPLSDLRFFAIAILVQKETGGNVAEILDNISRLIRERIQFKRQVKALTAEGRYSAAVLIALPIFMFIYIYITNYDYLSMLWTEKLGHYLLFGAIVMQIVGAYIIKRIVTIEI